MFAFDSRCDNRCVQETRNCQKKNYSLEGIQKLSKQPYSWHVLSTAIAIKLFYGIWYSQSYDAENNHECICRPIFSSALWMIWMLSCNAGRSLLINVTDWNNRWWMAMINCIDPVLVTASSTPGRLSTQVCCSHWIILHTAPLTTLSVLDIAAIHCILWQASNCLNVANTMLFQSVASRKWLKAVSQFNVRKGTSGAENQKNHGTDLWSEAWCTKFSAVCLIWRCKLPNIQIPETKSSEWMWIARHVNCSNMPSHTRHSVSSPWPGEDNGDAWAHPHPHQRHQVASQLSTLATVTHKRHPRVEAWSKTQIHAALDTLVQMENQLHTE